MDKHRSNTIDNQVSSAYGWTVLASGPYPIISSAFGSERIVGPVRDTNVTGRAATTFCLKERPTPAYKSAEAILIRTPLLFSTTIATVFGLTVLVLTVVMIAMVISTPLLIDLPSSYLPGGTLPQEVSCYTPSDEYTPRCSVPLNAELPSGTVVHFEFDPASNQILRSIVPVHYSMGQLYAAWGRPSGIRWNSHTVRVYWNEKSALFYIAAFQPQSRAMCSVSTTSGQIDEIKCRRLPYP